MGVYIYLEQCIYIYLEECVQLPGGVCTITWRSVYNYLEECEHLPGGVSQCQRQRRWWRWCSPWQGHHPLYTIWGTWSPIKDVFGLFKIWQMKKTAKDNKRMPWIHFIRVLSFNLFTILVLSQLEFCIH